MRYLLKLLYCVFITIGILSFLICGCKKDEDKAIIDSDGNVYTSVTIGAQVWMVENLKTTRFNDGTAIPLVTDDEAWAALYTPGYCWYFNDSATYKSDFGALYNWYSVNTGKLCPKGWHVPSDDEWLALIAYLGGADVAGGKLKESGTDHWKSPNTGATNSSGFSALPGSGRTYLGTYHPKGGSSGYWWTSTPGDAWHSGNAVNFDIQYDATNVYRHDENKKESGKSVRCLRD